MARLSLLAVVVAGFAAWPSLAADDVEAAAALQPAERRPIELPEDGYVSSKPCATCHPGTHASWHASYHRTMTQVAGPDSVLAPFAGEELEWNGGKARMQRRGEEYWARFESRDDAAPSPKTSNPKTSNANTGEANAGNTTNTDGVSKRVVMATGSHHFQAYWTSNGTGREVELFPFAYQIAEQRWIATDHLVLSDPKRATLESVWNKHCVQCHATGAKPRLLSGSDTRVAELGIACEACHGPAAHHVEANHSLGRRYRLHLSEEPDPTIVNPARLSHERSAEVCGQCHSVNTFYSREDTRAWSEQGYPYRPGDVLADSRHVFDGDAEYSVAGETAFWSDDVVRVNGREYNSLRKTACFQRGELTCISCHSMHQTSDDSRPVGAWAEDQLRPGMRGNAACLSCHERLRDEAQLAAHTHHAADSVGSRCYDCHMPHTAYGLHKATRSHQVTSPDLADEVATGRPNACNLCHLDQSLGWTAAHLQQWYGTPAPTLNDAQRRLAAAVVWSLAGDAGQRALVGWHMGWRPAQDSSGTDWLAPFLAELLVDPYPAVRSLARRSLATIPGYGDLSFDFEAKPSELAAAQRFVLERWRRSRPAGQPPEFRILQTREGLNQTLFDEVRKRRDNRFVWVQE